jgi:hypothetical protein
LPESTFDSNSTTLFWVAPNGIDVAVGELTREDAQTVQTTTIGHCFKTDKSENVHMVSWTPQDLEGKDASEVVPVRC